MITIHNTETGEIVVRELTKDELAQQKIDADNALALTQLHENENLAKEAALAKLQTLGLTLDDLKALGL